MKIFTLLTAVLLVYEVDGQCLSSLNAVKNAMGSAGKNAIICIADGTYSGWKLDITKSDITLKAQDSGKVIFKGESSFNISASRVQFTGFKFTAPKVSNKEVIPIFVKGRSTGSKVYECMIDNHAAYIWVKVMGHGNEVHHNTFKNKQAPPLNASNHDKPLAPANFILVSMKGMTDNKIYNNKFLNYPRATKSQDAAESVFVRLSADQNRLTHACRTTIANNYFYSCNTEKETIGIKSSGNFIYGNAIDNNHGGISLRQGKNNTVRGNFIVGRADRPIINFGINVHNDNHVVENNWIMDIGKYVGLEVTGGDGNSTQDKNLHTRAGNVTLTNNTLINSVLVLSSKRSHYQDPQDIKIKDLTVAMSKDFPMIKGYNLVKKNNFEGRPYTFSGTNRFFGTQLAADSAVVKELQPLADHNIQLKAYKDLGSYGKDMVRKIKCAAGTSWETKPSDC